MDIKTYSQVAIEFNKPMGYEKQVFHATLGLASEAGEFADAVKANLVYNKPSDLINMVEELGDALWFINLAAITLEVPLEDIMKANIAKLSTRYQDGYSDAKALGRHKEMERQAIKESLGLED